MCKIPSCIFLKICYNNNCQEVNDSQGNSLRLLNFQNKK
uniref:Uncharacterized protein n=1 Tax=Siphoviridae sp. ct2vX3 TaxID=2825318 RepID=A0A8S5PXX1_9CAUD|nr:MAG TPA: hypothetical protein [Siphoviridae sp. ct2vX3]